MTAQQIYQTALKNKRGLYAFNFASLDVLKALLTASEQTSSPVILSASESAISFIGEAYLKAIIKTAKTTTKTPIIFHLDHGKSFEVCKKAISLGFDSVMIDASALPLDENIKKTKKVVDYAHKKGIWVEAELGRLSGVEDETKSDKNIFTDPDEAKRFVKETGVDSLAVAVGTSHGAYKFSGEPTLRLDILKKINKLLPSFPLVLHGASNIDQESINECNKFGAKIKGAKGVPTELIQKAVREHNVVKINCDSDLRLAFLQGVRESLATSPENIDYRNYLKNGADKVCETAKIRINRI